MNYNTARRVKNLVNVVMTLFVFSSLTGCAYLQPSWPREERSALYETLSNLDSTNVHVSVEVNVPNKSHNQIIDAIRRTNSPQISFESVDKFLASTNIRSDIERQLAKLGDDGQSDERLELKASFGLSSDLKIAGLHFTMGLQSESCRDEFDVIRTTSIDGKKQKLNGVDVTLVNQYSNMRKLFAAMAEDAKSLIEMHLQSRQPFFIQRAEPQVTPRYMDFITFDGRNFSRVVGIQAVEKTIAYRDRSIQRQDCRSIHVMVTNSESLDVIEALAQQAHRAKQRREYFANFSRQQEERNRRIFYDRKLKKARAH